METANKKIKRGNKEKKSELDREIEEDEKKVIVQYTKELNTLKELLHKNQIIELEQYKHNLKMKIKTEQSVNIYSVIDVQKLFVDGFSGT